MQAVFLDKLPLNVRIWAPLDVNSASNASRFELYLISLHSCELFRFHR